MGKGQKQTTNTSSTQTGNQYSPAIQQQGMQNMWQGNWAAQNYSPAMMQTPAGMTQDQYAADYLANNGLNAGAGAVQSGVNAATGASTYTPQAVNPASYSATGYQGTMINPASIGYTASTAGSQGYNPALLGTAQAYNAATGNSAQINPNAVQQISSAASPAALQGYLQAFAPVYQQQIQAAMAPLQTAYQQSLQQNGAQAAQAGAFGDSRQGVMDAQSNGLYQQNVANLAANLNNQMLNNASTLYQQQQGLGLNAQEANQNTALNAGTVNANLAQSMGMANLGYQNAANQYNANEQNNFKLANQVAQNTAGQFGASAANTAALQNAAAQNQASQASMLAQLRAEEADQNSANQANQYTAGAQNMAGQYNAGLAQQAALANQGAGLSGEGLNLSASAALGNLGNLEQGMNLNNINALNGLGTQQQNYNQSILNTNYANQQALAQLPLERAQIQQQFLQGTLPSQPATSTGKGNGTTTYSPTTASQIMQDIGAGLQLPALFLSDERLKENIQPMNSAMDAVRKIKPAAYSWKGDTAKRQNLGLIAQNVEKAAPAAVSTMPNGVKAVHVPAMLGLLTSAVQHLDKKVSKRK